MDKKTGRIEIDITNPVWEIATQQDRDQAINAIRVYNEGDIWKVNRIMGETRGKQYLIGLQQFFLNLTPGYDISEC